MSISSILTGIDESMSLSSETWIPVSVRKLTQSNGAIKRYCAAKPITVSPLHLLGAYDRA